MSNQQRNIEQRTAAPGCMQAREAVSQALAALDQPLPDPETKALAVELAEIEERLLAVNKRMTKQATYE